MLDLTPESFSQEIEKTADYMDIGYLDTILHLCDRYTIEPEFASQLLSQSIIEKLHTEGVDLNIIPKTSKLPL